MADYKMVDATQLDTGLKDICNAIRSEDSGYRDSDLFSFPDGIKDAINQDVETLYSIIGRTGSELTCNAKRLGSGCFYNWAGLQKARLPVGQLFLTYCFRSCADLTTVDVGDPTRTDIYTTSNSNDLYFANNAFNGATALETLILRPNIVAKLQGTQVFSGTAIASGTGYIYVPSALVAAYKSAWSTYESQIRAIEDYPEITGGD